tara:strand:- start:6 stop:152 length:147 start_codon:yes stop_codon:yes gene_type:complete
MDGAGSVSQNHHAIGKEGILMPLALLLLRGHVYITTNYLQGTVVTVCV